MIIRPRPIMGTRLAYAAATLLLAVVLPASALDQGPPAGAAPTTGGTVRWGIDLVGETTTAGGVNFDPTVSQAAAAEEPWQLPIYDSLLRVATNGSLVPGLARAVKIVNTETIALTLRPGVRFSDGTSFDAAAVKAGILRNEDAPNHGQFRAQLYDVSSIDVDGPLSLIIHLSQPVAAAFYPLLSSPETYIVSPKAASNPSVDLNKAPVGAGPFLLQQYVPNEQIVLVKNPTYYAASTIRIHEIDIVNVPGGPQQVNALESGTIDAGSVPLNDLATVRNGSFQVQTVQVPGSMVWMPICKTAAPFDDVRVRQALSYAIDRPVINRAVLQGTGQPQWSLWPPGSPLAPASLNGYYAYNPAKARALLAAAGVHDLSIKVLPLPGIPVLQQVAQILQQQWKAVGVTVTIGETSNFVTDLYVNHDAPLGLISDMPAGPTGLDMLNRIFVPGAIGDLCGYDNPTLDQIAQRLNAATPGSAQAAALWNAAQQIIVKQALAIFLNSLPMVQASDAKVGGNRWLPSTFGPLLNYWTIYVK